ncbi:hypothetical protein CPB84DRAFT_1744130 [Gymnopilus junonius]|uniref:Uncharacterized protein n=1 Tax=Gymnopilus junonius TaxID=109634 RepID=A0A9P5NY32_GYMJU|nr:hypothetical protein CPB84DRAFT_1744130 [Gymnopilus junonius]
MTWIPEIDWWTLYPGWKSNILNGAVDGLELGFRKVEWRSIKGKWGNKVRIMKIIHLFFLFFIMANTPECAKVIFEDTFNLVMEKSQNCVINRVPISNQWYCFDSVWDSFWVPEGWYRITCVILLKRADNRIKKSHIPLAMQGYPECLPSHCQMLLSDGQFYVSSTFPEDYPQ